MRLRNLAAGIAAISMVLVPASAALADDPSPTASESAPAEGCESPSPEDSPSSSPSGTASESPDPSESELVGDCEPPSGTPTDEESTPADEESAPTDDESTPAGDPPAEEPGEQPAPREPADEETCEPSQDLLDLVDALPVEDEMNSGYDRASFAYDSRQAVLDQEQRDDGTWLSVWDGTVHESADTLEVDHTVALAEAWGSGAHAWTDEERRGFANDTDNRYVMNAITAEVNSAKGASDPFDWMPEANRGEYVKQWATVKTRYGLSVDGEEKMRLHAVASEVCGDEIAVPDAQRDVGEAQEEVGVPGGEMADTGASGPPPWLLIGAALMAIGSGGALVLLRRKGML